MKGVIGYGWQVLPQIGHLDLTLEDPWMTEEDIMRHPMGIWGQRCHCGVLVIVPLYRVTSHCVSSILLVPQLQGHGLKTALVNQFTLFQILYIFRDVWGSGCWGQGWERMTSGCVLRWHSMNSSPGNSTMARVSQADLILLRNSQI